MSGQEPEEGAPRRVRLVVAYDGSGFHGWQIQTSDRTVEGELTEAVRKLNGVRVKVQGASRTDAGVHATGQVAHFDDAHGRSPEQLYRALNRLTPRDMAIVSVAPTSPDFHARHRARGKIYRYLLQDGFHVDPLLRTRVWHIPKELDVDAMQDAARVLVGTMDFASFQASGCQANGTIRTLRRVNVRRLENRLIEVRVEGDAFLKYMVRNICGTLVSVGRGSRGPDWMREVLAGRDRRAAGKTAPAHGLTLEHVLYPIRPLPPELD